MSKCGSYNTHFVVFFYKHRMHITFEAVCKKAENKTFYLSNKLRNFCPFGQKRRDLSHAVFSLWIFPVFNFTVCGRRNFSEAAFYFTPF